MSLQLSQENSHPKHSHRNSFDRKNLKTQKKHSPPLNSSRNRHNPKKTVSSIPLININYINPMTYDLQKLLKSKLNSSSSSAHLPPPALNSPKTTRSSRHQSVGLPYQLGNSCDLFSQSSHRNRKYSKKAIRKFRKRKSFERTPQKSHQQEQLAECSFQPSINSKSPNSRKRSLDQFYKDQIRFKKISEKKILKKRQEKQRIEEEKQVKSLQSKPNISARSQKIMTTRTYSPLPIYQRLHQMNQSIGHHQFFANYCNSKLQLAKQNSSTEDFSFIPKLNKKSKRLQRKSPIENRLYEDALRRVQKISQMKFPFQFQASSHSVSILSNKILKEFDELIQRLDVRKTGVLNYLKFRHLLIKMRYIRTQNSSQNSEVKLILELWHQLSSNQQVKVSDLRVAVMGIMGYFQNWMKTSNLNFTQNEEQIKKYHQKYKILFENRILNKSKPQKPKENCQRIIPPKTSTFSKEMISPNTFIVEELPQFSMMQSMISQDSIRSCTDSAPSIGPPVNLEHSLLVPQFQQLVKYQTLHPQIEVVSNDQKKIEIASQVKRNSFTAQEYDFSLSPVNSQHMTIKIESDESSNTPTISSSPISFVNASNIRRNSLQIAPRRNSFLSFKNFMSFKNN